MEFATCNIETGKISGCKENSNEYKHEEAHLTFADKYAWLSWVFEMIQFFTLVSLAITPFIDYFKYFTLILIGLLFFIFIFEEVWCNYESEKYLNDKNNINNINVKDNI